MTADLPDAVRAEAAKAARKVRYPDTQPQVIGESWFDIADAVASVVVPAMLELEERAHASTSAECARLEAENAEIKSENLDLGDVFGKLEDENLRLREQAGEMAEELERLRGELEETAADALSIDSENNELAARVVVLTEALRDAADSLESSHYSRRWDALDSIRAALAGEEKP